MPQAEGDAEEQAASARSKASPSPLRNDGRFVTGAILAGRYRVVSLLGVGGMGEVEHPDANRIKAELPNLGLRIRVDSGSALAIIATIRTPKGDVELR